MALSRLVTAPMGRWAQTVGRTYDYLTPGAGTSTLTNAGRSITDLNQVYTGGSKDGVPSFTAVQGAKTTTPYQTGQGNTGGGDQTETQLGGSTGGSGGGSFDPSSIWEAQDALDQANQYLGMIPQQQQMFNQNLASTFAKYRQNLEQDFGRNQGNYNTNRTQTIQDQEKAKSAIDTKVRMRSNALQRLLGASGAGDSEAAQFLAPYAAARTGTQLRSQVNDQYGRNLSGLDQSWGQYNTDYQNSLTDLADQEANQRKTKEQEFLQKQFDLTDQQRKAQAALRYAQGGNVAEARALRDQALPALYQLLQQIQNLGATQVTPTAKDASYAAPELGQYTTEGAQDIQGVDQSVAGDINPMYQWLLKKQQEDQNYFGY